MKTSNKQKLFQRVSLKRGFTVFESIIAIFILSLAISGVFSVVQTSLSQATIAKDEVRAFYLAQEAIELVRNKRDSNQLDKIVYYNSTNWLSGISESSSDPCYFNSVCRVDASSNTFTSCGSSWDTCPVLKQNPSNFLYGYNISWNSTGFKREIMIEPLNTSTDEIVVIVKVSWSKGIINKKFVVKTHLFNWAS